MEKYNEYSKSISKIFEILEKMKTEMPDQDNINYIDSIYEYKDDVLNTAEILKSGKSDSGVESLGND